MSLNCQFNTVRKGLSEGAAILCLTVPAVYGELDIRKSETLNRGDRGARAENGCPNIRDSGLRALKKADKDVDRRLPSCMRAHCFDVRAFGAATCWLCMGAERSHMSRTRHC